MAEAFSVAGAEVVIASRKLEACGLAADEISAMTGRRAVGIAFHAGNWDDAERLVENVGSSFGRLDVLVNNAGMSPLYESLPAVSEALFDKVIAVNLKGPFRLASLVGTQMVESGRGGSIINISSIAAVAPTPVELVYASAKSGLNTMTLGLARAFGPLVRCNAIMPGPFLTDISKAWDIEAFTAQAERDIPLRRGGQAHEVVGAALYLASDASAYTTGAVLKVDGGAAVSPA
jgi:NAD(P)-dependent dehydrogenase (short-subunit alcohol dehydrogenase family)